MASTEDEYIPGDRDALYSPGRSLVLNSHQAPPPYGHMYPNPHNLRPADMALSDDESVLSRTRQVFKETNRPHGFSQIAQIDRYAQLHVTIIKAIPGNRGQGDFSGPVNLLGRVTKASSKQNLSVGDLTFIKVFDPLLWWKDVELLDRCLKVTTRADMAFCDEVGAYSFLQQKGLTGFPHLAPELFGSWTAAVTSSNPEFEGQTRHVGVLALEYIDGYQLDKLFTPMERPRASSVQFYEDTDTPVSFNTDEATRMDVMAKLLGGNMQQEFAGITHGDIHPRSVIVSMRNGNTILDSPRVALVGWRTSVVDSIAREPQAAFAYYSKPPHPWRRYNIVRLRPFLGWISRDWQASAQYPRHSPQLNRWMFDTFGSLHNPDNPDFQTWAEQCILDKAFGGLTVTTDAATPSI
ncbi:hypothetical protein GCG54_00012361 [Colletotrichum gloeosporioides]|uniref:Protein kinase domain-containing protein n=1 Tax=Colletotrichum gloeosporioides TaxID=474922 RepID=A0A8H4FHD8_COLGL|nr:uncharacterized protein GCG54_00012361 [Colletotrichum gloeosporioides]KAF3802115.1 hypothetical protein GCG54_00012361 [Colletotrichum gloeosporioides]